MAWVVCGCIGLTAVAAMVRNPVVFVLAYFFWGVLLGATTPVLMALISKSVDSSQQGHVLGIAQSTAQLASIAGISAGGLLSQVYGLQYTYLFVCLAYGVALVPIVALRYRPVFLQAGETSSGD